MDDLGPFCCQNPDGADVGKRGHGDRTVTSRYGAGKSRRMLRCSTCKARFSERKGTPLFKARLTSTTAVAVLAHVAEGVGTRKTARLTGVHPDTVTRYTRRAGDHAAEPHDELVALSPEDQSGEPTGGEPGGRQADRRRGPRAGPGLPPADRGGG